jgi:hypothetical protein
MMRTFHLKDGGTVTAAFPAEFVTRLREGSMFDSECTDEAYMKNFADRYKIQSGHPVRADTPEQFLDDLLASGYILTVSE